MLRYPKYDLEDSVAVARAIHEEGGGTATREQLAHWLGYAGVNNGAFLNRVAAARLFGLIEGQSNSLLVTDRALRILKPDYPQAEKEARLEAFEGVPLYAAFLMEYGDKPLPDKRGMLNALESRLGVTRNPTRVLNHMLDSAEQAGYFEIAGNRTKLIRPTVGREKLVATVPAPEPEPKPDASGAVVQVPERQFPKLIEGLLDELPQDSEWDEALLRDWLDLFERALRVRYRLPRERGQAGRD